MMWRLFHSLRGRLIALVLLGAVPGLGAILYTAETQRQRDAVAAQAEAMRTVQFVAGTQRELFAETQRLLQVLAQLPAVHEGSAASCSALLTHLHKQDPAPRYSSFFAVRPDGDVFCSSAPLTRRINAADQAYYRRVLATRAFAVGDYQIGRITGRAIIVLAQPVLDAAGAVRAVVGAGIDLAWLNRLAAEARLPAGSTLTLVDHAGTVLARNPDGEKWIGRSLAGTPQLAAMHAQHDGTLEIAGLDGVRRLYAFTAIYESHQEGHAHLSIGIPAAAVFAEADRTRRRHLLTFALAVLLMLAAAWAGGHVFVLRQVNALLGAVQRLSAGDLGARAGLSAGVSEIGRLAQAFNRMAAALEQRTRDNEEKERRIVRLNRVYATLSRINSAIIRLRGRTELLQETCRIAVEEGRFRLAWIGHLEPGSRELAPAQWYGSETDALRSLRLPLDAIAPGAAEPIGALLRAGRALVCNDIARAPPPEREAALACGARACALLPLHAAGNVVGALNLYAAEPDFFDVEEVKLLEELAADISLGLEYIEKDDKLHRLSYYDPLTDLPNRLLFGDRLHQALSRAPRYRDRHVAVLMLDVARLKEINSLHGHHAGDALLRDVARRLRALLRPGDTAARFGSATFGILLVDVAEASDVATVAGRMAEALQAPVTLNGEELFVTARLGIAVSPRDGDEAEMLIRHAEAAVRLPPAEAGGAFHFYTAEIDQQAMERLELEKALRRALERRELSLHYQPVVDLQTLEVVGAEALMRWQHPVLGAVSPARFIPVAEETGLIVPLGEWALETALAQSRHWQARGLPVTVAVNLSVKQLQQADFAERLAGLLEAAGPTRLALEITESLLMKAPERYVALLNALRTQGLSIYIDDFGTGYSSLTYLKRLPVDTLKIDISFVRDIARDPEDAAIVKAIVALAHSLGMKAIAEGVETAEQFSALRALSVDAAQGFLFSPAVPAEAFEALGRRPFHPLGS